MARNEQELQENARNCKNPQENLKGLQSMQRSRSSPPFRPLADRRQRGGRPQSLLERRGGFSPRKLYGTGSVKERGKGLRRAGVRRAAATAPGPGRGSRVPTKGMSVAEPVLNGALRNDDFPLDHCTFLADSGQVIS